MNQPISNTLRTTFLVHCVVAFLFGVAFILIPGRTLNLLGWVPDWVELPDSESSVPGGTFVDPVITRVLGAALIALSFSSFRAWQGANRNWDEVAILVQMELVFTVLSTIAIIAGGLLMVRSMPVIGWVLAAIMAAFAIAFGLALRRSKI